MHMLEVISDLTGKRLACKVSGSSVQSRQSVNVDNYAVHLAVSQLPVQKQVQRSGVECSRVLVQHGFRALEGKIPEHYGYGHCRSGQNDGRMLDLESRRNGDDGSEEQYCEDLLLGQFLPVEEHYGHQNQKMDGHTDVKQDMKRTLDKVQFPVYLADREDEACERIDQLYSQEQGGRSKQGYESLVAGEGISEGKYQIDAHQKRHDRLQAVEQSVHQIVHPDRDGSDVLQRDASCDIEGKVQHRA